MTMHQIYPTIVEALLLPRLIRLEKNLYAAAFVLMKLLPARFMLDQAQDAGLLQPGSVVIETSSGTFGLALALLCNLRNYQLYLVSDSAIDAPLKRRLEDLGAKVERVREPAQAGGLQQARLDRLAELRALHANHYWPSQYDNPNNPQSYARLAQMLTEALGPIDCLVGPVGSGGSMCGTTAHLREVFPKLHAVGVDTRGSVLFGQPDQKRFLRGLGNSILPKNLHHSIFDEVHWVDAADAFCAARILHRQKSLYMGPTSGASYLVARWWAEKHPDAKVVALFADEGYRYQETIYNDAWLHENDLWISSLSAEPVLVEHPLQAENSWSRILWSRRTYAQVVSGQGETKVFDG